MENILEFISENKIIIGNAFGLLCALFAFLSYQAKTPKTLLKYQIGLSLSATVSYAILGAPVGVAMNIVCVIRNLLYSSEKKIIFNKKIWSYILAVVLAVLGILSWEGTVSLLEIIPLIINTVILSWGDNNKLRFSILFTSSSVLAYDLFFSAFIPAVMEACAIISSAIGLIKFRKNKETVSDNETACKDTADNGSDVR